MLLEILGEMVFLLQIFQASFISQALETSFEFIEFCPNG